MTFPSFSRSNLPDLKYSLAAVLCLYFLCSKMRLPALGEALSSTTNSLVGLSLGKKQTQRHRVLVVGCAYGGITAVLNLLDLEKGKARQAVYPGADLSGRRLRGNLDITVIDERDGYFHSVGAPLAHVTPKHTSLMWRRFTHLNELKSPNLTFHHGSVKAINPSTKTATWHDRNNACHQQPYDYLIMATGLKRHWPAVPKSGSYEEYLQDGKAFISKIVGAAGPEHPQDGRRVVVIGAGAVGIEFSAEIKHHYPGIHVTLIHSRSQVLSSEPLPSEVKDRVATMLAEEGVSVILGNRASITEQPNGEYTIALADGRTLTADFVIDSTKKGEPTTEVLPKECLNDDGEIKVEQTLMFQSPSFPNRTSHFGVGDVIAWSGIKRAGSAMVMGQTAAHNIYISILNGEASTCTTSDPAAAQSASPLPMTELPAWPAVIGIAVGKQCLTYDKSNGIKYGEDVMQGYFQDDLGWASNLRYLQLTDVVEELPEVPAEEVAIGEVGVEAVSAAA